MKKLKFSCARDNFIIRGYEYKLKNNNGIPIIISHGFLANQSHLKYYAKGLARDGYVVFTYDFCGGGILSKSDGKFIDMSIITEKADLKTVINYVMNLNYVKAENLILIGESQCGLVSCLVASEFKNKINKLIMLYPALCIPDDAKKGKMLFMRFDPNNIEKTLKCKLFKFSPEYPKSAICLNVYEEIKKITANIFIIHGDKDRIVNVDYAKRVKDIIKNSKLEILKGAGHGFNKKQSNKAIGLIIDNIKNS